MKKELEYYLSAYAIFMHKRKLPSEKTSFLNNNIAIYTNAGHNAKIETSKVNDKVQHIVIGNIDKAKKIIMTSYDAVNKTILPSFKFYPTNLDKSKSYEVLNICLSLVILLSLCVISAISFQRVSNDGTFTKILMVVLFLILMFLVYKWIFSSCKINLSQDYFLSIIYALADNNEGDDVAYVLCDNSRINYFGMRDFLKEHEKVLVDKKIIILSELVTDLNLFAVTKNFSVDKNDFIVLNDNNKHNILKYIKSGCLITGAYKDGDDVMVSGHRNNGNISISIDKINEIYRKIEKVSKSK